MLKSLADDFVEDPCRKSNWGPCWNLPGATLILTFLQGKMAGSRSRGAVLEYEANVEEIKDNMVSIMGEVSFIILNQDMENHSETWILLNDENAEIHNRLSFHYSADTVRRNGTFGDLEEKTEALQVIVSSNRSSLCHCSIASIKPQATYSVFEHTCLFIVLVVTKEHLLGTSCFSHWPGQFHKFQSRKLQANSIGREMRRRCRQKRKGDEKFFKFHFNTLYLF